MGKKYLALVILSSFLCSSVVFAAPVRIPGGETSQGILSNGSESAWIAGVGVEYDHVDKVELEESSDANFDVASGLLSLTYDKKYSIYGVFGEILNPEFKDNVGSGFEADFDDTFMWGVGANGVVFDQDGYQLFVDGSYRATDDMDFNKIMFGSTTYTKVDLIPGAAIEGKVEEWQAALGVTKDFEWIKPYAGILYLDSKYTVKVSVTGNSESASIKNKDKVGGFVGATVSPLKWLDLNVQGRFIGETAVMGSVTLKF